MQVGIFAKTFDVVGAQRVFAAMRAAGFDCTQFNMACVGLESLPERIDRSLRDAIAAASDDTKVAVAGVSGTYNMIHPDPQIRRDGLERLRVLIAAAPAMGTQLVTLCTGTRDPHDQWRRHRDNGSKAAWRDLLDEMAKAVALAEEHDVDLGIEPEPANVIASAELAQHLIDSLASPRIRIVLDAANIVEASDEGCERATVERAVDLLADRIAIAHAKDRDAQGHVVAAGSGVVDFPHFVAYLKSVGFDGPLVAHGLSAQDAPGVSKFLKRCVETA